MVLSVEPVAGARRASGLLHAIGVRGIGQLSTSSQMIAGQLCTKRERYDELRRMRLMFALRMVDPTTTAGDRHVAMMQMVITDAEMRAVAAYTP